MPDTQFINNISPVILYLTRFLLFVRNKDRQLNGSYDGMISFSDTNGFLGMEEGYKSGIAEKAREELNFKDWKETWIGTGKIASCAAKAIGKASNLVNMNQQIDFRNRLNPLHKSYCPDAERVLYEIYRGTDEKKAFEMAVNAFGAKYDTIAFLFFIKDCERFLPISPGNFDKCFQLLEIDYATSHNCSWENYTGFISIISEIQSLMNDILPLKSEARLIDAHSFVWIVHEDKFINRKTSEDDIRKTEQFSEDLLQQIVTGNTKRTERTVYTYTRSAEVVKAVKARAKGICQLCKKAAPFLDSKGLPYLEVHHVIWLSRGGKDDTNNAAALCPNCHKKMHIVDDRYDVMLLLNLLK